MSTKPFLNDQYAARPIEEKDIASLLDYWYHASDDYLIGMGVDVSKLPNRADFSRMLQTQLQLPMEQKSAFATIWTKNEVAIGHCNVNPIIFAKEAYMHLHLWYEADRGQGLGAMLVRESLPFFFEYFQLETLYSQPYAENEGPNRVLEKVGFTLNKTYRTIPGSINFEQEVHQWILTKSRFDSLEK